VRSWDAVELELVRYLDKLEEDIPADKLLLLYGVAEYGVAESDRPSGAPRQNALRAPPGAVTSQPGARVAAGSHINETARLSVSMRSAFDNCPLMFYRRYKDRACKIPPLPKGMNLGLRGFILHRIAQAFDAIGNGNASVNSPQLDPAELSRDFSDEFFPDGRLRSDYRFVGFDRETALKNSLWQFVVNANSFFQTALVGHNLVVVDRYYEIPAPNMLVRGSVDLVTRDPQGTHHLFFWTTGNPKNARYRRSEYELRQLLGMKWAQAEFGVADLQAATIFLADPTCGESAALRWRADWGDFAMREMRAFQSNLAGRVQYLARPSRLCDWCEWRPSCS
jgi:hypothetical protein